jgi:hypothetical protein
VRVEQCGVELGTRLQEVVALRSRLHFGDNNFCLDAPDGQAGLTMRVWRCNGTLAQRWEVGIG